MQRARLEGRGGTAAKGRVRERRRVERRGEAIVQRSGRVFAKNAIVDVVVHITAHADEEGRGPEGGQHAEVAVRVRDEPHPAIAKHAERGGGEG